MPRSAVLLEAAGKIVSALVFMNDVHRVETQKTTHPAL
jgi:hypothetical protein